MLTVLIVLAWIVGATLLLALGGIILWKGP